MGSEINVRDLSNSKNDRASMPSHSRLLTLPTILTLGRVASIPLLVASAFPFLLFIYLFIWLFQNCAIQFALLVYYIYMPYDWFIDLLQIVVFDYIIFLLFYLAFYMDGWQGTTVTTSIFTAAAVTDWLDGYIARKVTNQLIQILSLPLPTFQSSIQHFSLALQMKLKSSFGAFLDPVADKVILLSFSFNYRFPFCNI
jgi:hypothetical protein